MSMQKVFLVGRLGAAPELRTSAAGEPWAILSVATDKRVRQGDGWVDHTDWHRVKVFGDRAQHCHKYLRKGSLVGVDGQIAYERWTDGEGRLRFSCSIRARRVEFLTDFGRSEPAQAAPAEAVT